MHWLGKRQTAKGLELSIGPYVTPKRRFFVYYFLYALLGAVFLGTFIFLVEVYDGGEGVYRFFSNVPFIKFQWVFWMVENPLQVSIGALVLIILLSRLAAISGILALFFLGKHSKVVFTPETIKIRQFFFFWRTCPRSKTLSFDMKHHPRAGEGEMKAQRRGKYLPLDNTFAQTGIVLMRCGPVKLTRIAIIFDWKGFGVGHKAEQLLLTLQTPLNESVEINRQERDYQDFYGDQP